MIIKFSCSKHCLDFEKTEEELRAEHVITHCPYCGEKLHIQNLNEVLESDLYAQANETLDKYLKELGGDETLSLMERNKTQACYRIYKDILIKRGFIVK